MRRKDIDNIGEAQSGMTTYEKLATAVDLKEIEHAELWATQSSAYCVYVVGWNEDMPPIAC